MKKILWIAFLLAILTSCHKSMDNPGPQPTLTPIQTGPYFYIGGGLINGQGAYYKSPLSHAAPVLDTLKNAGIITSIVSMEDGIYMAAQTQGYYKNDSFISINNAGSIQYLAFSGSTVYAAGLDYQNGAGYWVGSSETKLNNTFGRNLFPDEGVTTYSVSGINISGGKVYVTGSLFFENEPMTPDSVINGSFAMFWTNGNLQLYGPGQSLSAVYKSTMGVAVSGNDIYIAGRYPDTTYAGGYWKNGVWSSIDNGAFVPAAIAAVGSHVYMPGTIYTYKPGGFTVQAAYWLDGNLDILDGAYSIAIAFYMSDVYILGVDNQNNFVVWKNGITYQTLGSASTFIATSLGIR